MKHTRIIVTRYGGPDALQVLEEECPEPKDGEVRVRVLAAGVSLPDLMAREGVHPETPPVPFTPRCRSAVRTRSSYACRRLSWFRCRPGWTPPRPSASC